MLGWRFLAGVVEPLNVPLDGHIQSESIPDLCSGIRWVGK